MDHSANNPAKYQVIARRYRPATFDDLVGQGHVSTALKNAITAGRVGHAYLFTGARGVGKTSTARIVAKALNCAAYEAPTTTPCNECDICQSIASGEDVDVLEIDGASNRGIDEVRELRQGVNLRPSRSRYKVYIIDEVHMLTREAFNALLKTLEEPPDHVKFIFCTTEAEKIPVTILSRCQRFDFAGIQTTSIVDRLAQIAAAEGLQAEPDALALVARMARGSMRDSQSLLEQLLSTKHGQLTVADVRTALAIADDRMMLEVCAAVAARDPRTSLALFDKAINQGIDPGLFLEQLLGILRDCMVASVGCGPELFAESLPAQSGDIATISQALGLESILAGMQVIDHSLGRMRSSSHAKTLAELALVRLCQLQDLQALANVLYGLKEKGPILSDKVVSPPVQEVVLSPALTASPQSMPPQSTPGGQSAAAVGGPLIAPSNAQASPVVSPAIKTAAHAAVTSTPGTMAAPAVHQTAKPAAPDPSVVAPWEPAAALTKASAKEPGTTGANSRPSAEITDIPQEDTASTAQPPAAEKKNRSGDQEPSKNGLTSDSAEITSAASSAADWAAIWSQLVSQNTDMLSMQAKMASRFAIRAPNQLIVTFPKQYNFAKAYCERPEHLSRLEQSLRSLTHAAWKLELHLAEDDETIPEQSAPDHSIDIQQNRKVLEHPLVRRAIEVLGADPGQIERITESNKAQR